MRYVLGIMSMSEESQSGVEAEFVYVRHKGQEHCYFISGCMITHPSVWEWSAFDREFYECS